MKVEALIVCRDVKSTEYGKVCLLDVVRGFAVLNFPGDSGPFAVFIAIRAPRGKQTIKLFIGSSSSDLQFEGAGDRDAVELTVRTPSIRVPSPGTIKIQVVSIEGEVLIEKNIHFIQAVQVPNFGSGGAQA